LTFTRDAFYLHSSILSSKSVFDKKKAIRGGIPIVFRKKNCEYSIYLFVSIFLLSIVANFGPWDNNRPQHGFARIKRWSIKEPIQQVIFQIILISTMSYLILLTNFQSSDAVTVELSLKDDDETKQLWNHSFELLYKVTLTRQNLQTDLSVINTGSDDFDFTSLLHTYFRVEDINNVKIHSFQNLEYFDKVEMLFEY
jgi:glucose-6-phosphate 1-epimerase